MLNLSQLRFEVDSSQLEKAVETIREIGTAMDSLAKSSGKVTTSAEDTAKVIQKTSKVVKDSNEDIAESGDKVTAALEKATNALRFQADGYSKGQSGQLAYLKSLGATTEQLKEYGDVLQKQRVLQGTDPFDRSLSSMVAIRNEYRLLVDAQRQYGSGAELTMQQMKDLTIEKMRLITTAQMEGTSFKELRNSIRQLEAQYETAAGKVNNLRAAQAAQDKAAKDTANANAYIAKEMERVTFATSAMNSELNRSTTNALLRFEKQLKLSGLTVDEQTIKLNAYKAALLQMDEASKKTNTDYISRALGPQITDIFVGLSTGQSPLTVMLQQGGQLRDQLTGAGVAADQMGAAMRTAAADMVVSVKAVALAFGQLIGGAFIDAGKGLVNYVSEISFFNKAITSMQERTAAAAATGDVWALSLQALGHILPTVLGVAIAGSASALIAMAVAFYQVNKAQNEMSRNLVSFGASLGLTSQQAFDMAKNVSASGSSFSAILDVFSEIAKKGNIAQEAMQGITEAALKLESVGGNAATKTVELFSKLADDPVKALSEYAQATGLVTQAEILRIEALAKAGQEARATAEATRILEAAVKQEADLMYANLSPISRLWLDIKNGTKSAWAAVQEFSTANVILDSVVAVLQGIGVVAAGVWYTVKGLGYSLGALGAIAVAAMEDIKNLDTNFTALGRMKDSIRQSGEDLTTSFDDTMSRILQTGKYEQSVLEARAQAAAKERQANSEAEQERLQHQAAMKPWLEYQQKHAKDMMTRQEFVNKALEDANKKLKEGTQLRQKDVDLITKMAGMEWDKSNKSKSSKEKTETYSVVADNTAAQLQKEYNAELSAAKTLSTDKLDILKAELSAKLISQSEYNSQAEALIAQSEQNQFNVISDYVRQINEAYDNMRKKKDEAFASLPEKDQQNEQNIQKYKADIENLANAQQAFNTQVSSTVAKLDSDIFKRNTKNAIEHRGVIEALSKAYEDYLVAEGKVAEQRNRENVLREKLRWATPEQAAYIQAVAKETERLTQAQQKLADAVREANKEFEEASKNGPNPAAQKLAYEKLLAAQSAYNKALAENSVKEQQAGIDAVINYQRDQLKEFSNGLSDAIVTAMFEGGKAGAGKFRDIVVAQLKKPVVMIVNAVVNTLLGSVMGSIGNSLVGSALSSAGGSLLGSAAGSAAGSALGAGSWLGGGSFAGMIGNIGAGISTGFSTLFTEGIGAWFSQGTGLIGAGSTGGGLGVLGGPLAVLGGLAFLASSLDKSGTPHYGAASQYSGGKASGDAALFTSPGSASGRYSPQNQTAMDQVALGFGSLLDETAKAFGKEAGYSLFTAYSDDSSDDPGFGALRIERDGKKVIDWEDQRTSRWAPRIFADGEEGWKLYLAAIAKDTRQALMDMDLPSWAEQMLSDLGDDVTVEQLSGVVQQITIIQTAFENLGKTMDVFAGMNDKVFESLLELFGGIENLVQGVDFYYKNFYTEAERAAKATEILTNEFKNQGLVLPNTREEYRKLVEAQDLSTEEGRKMYKFLITLAPAFAEISDSAEKLAEDAAKAAEDAAKALRDKYTEALNSAYAALEKAVKAEQAILKERETAQAEVVKGLQNIFDILKNNVKELYMQVDSTAKMLASQGRQVINNALSTGVLPSADILSEAIGAVRSEIDGTAYATQFDADKARLQLAGDLKKLQDQTEVQLSTEELILRSVKDQIKRLDDILISMKTQVDAALGIKTSVLTVADALYQLRKVLDPNYTDKGNSSNGEYVVGGGGGSGNSTRNDPRPGKRSPSGNYYLEDYFGERYGSAFVEATAAEQQRLESISGVAMDAWTNAKDVTDFYQTLKDSGITLREAAAIFGYNYADIFRASINSGVGAFADGGVFTNGIVQRPTNFNMGLMGEDGPEAIMPLTNVGGKLGVAAVGTTDSSLVDRVKNLEIVLQVIAVNTSKVARILDSAQGEDGRSLMTTAA